MLGTELNMDKARVLSCEALQFQVPGFVRHNRSGGLLGQCPVVKCWNHAVQAGDRPPVTHTCRWVV